MANNNNQDNTNINPVQIQKYLGGVDYPANRDDLVKAARDNGAPDDVIKKIESLPDDSFQTPADVNKAIGETE